MRTTTSDTRARRTRFGPVGRMRGTPMDSRQITRTGRDMNAPTHIRFTQDENTAIDAYATAHGLRKASAVRALLQLGIDAANGPPAPGPDGAALARIEAQLAAVLQRLDAADHPDADARRAFEARLARLEQEHR